MTHYLTNPDRLPLGDMLAETKRLMQLLSNAGANVSCSLGWGLNCRWSFLQTPFWSDSDIYRLDPTPDPLAVGIIILHNGGPCPVPDGAVGSVWFRNGMITCPWDGFWWHHMGSMSDIIAYRIDSLPSTKPTAEDVLRQIAALPRSKGARKMAREWLDGNSPPKGPTP